MVVKSAVQATQLQEVNPLKTENETLNTLQARLVEVDDLQSAAALLEWDQETLMPAGGTAARGRQMATLRRLAHEKLTDPEIGRLLDALQPWAEGRPHDSDEASLVRVARREYERAIAVPSS
jgi:carboxypeptidase Taq